MRKAIAKICLRFLGVDAWDDRGVPFNRPKHLPETDD
jgi:hypothetical protein